MIVMEIACIIMASGWSTRFGDNKLLKKYHNKFIVQHIIEKANSLKLKCIVVTRYEEIRLLCSELGVPCVMHNMQYQNDTIRLGLEALGPDYAGYMFCTGDQPLISETSLIKLAENFKAKPQYIHRVAYKGQAGNPVIFPNSCYSQLCQLPQDQGGSFIIKQNKNQLRFTEAGSALELHDIDTINDLLELEQHNI